MGAQTVLLTPTAPQGRSSFRTFAVAFPARLRPVNRRRWRCGVTGKEAAQPWLDVTSFVTGAATTGPFVDLANEFGQNIYIDVNGWHLYLRDIKAGANASLAVALADKLGPQAGTLRDIDIENLLRQIPVKLGAGKAQVSLFDAIPAFGMQDLSRIVEDFARR